MAPRPAWIVKLTPKTRPREPVQVHRRPGGGQGLKTLNQIAGEHNVHPNQVSTWKKQLLADGPGVFDNIFVERLWRTVKYEDIYLKGYETVSTLAAGLDDYFQMYNYERPHQSLGYRTPADVHFAVEVPILWLAEPP